MVYFKKLKLDKILKKLPAGSGFLVAYSGGSDSTALLYLFSKLKKVRAIHINHGLHKDADAWQIHCQETCEKLNIPFIAEKYNLPDNSENTCRKARYKSFKQHLLPKEILLTAHHAGDQAETILLKLLRGTGLNGISGMAEMSPFHHSYLARVLLKHSTNDLKQYLINLNINWIEDDSNTDNNYRRNYIRNEIIPKLEKQWSHAIDNISRTGKNIHNSELLLSHYTNFQQNQLPIEQLISVPQALQSTLFYHWLCSKDLPVADKKTIKQICHDFSESSTDKNPHYKNEFYQLLRWKGAIYCLKNYDIINSDLSFKWNTKTRFELPNHCGFIHYKGIDNIDLVIKFNQTGQKLKPLNSKNTKTVKNLFQENNVPTWHKHHTPFIYKGGQLISLGSLWSACDKIGQDIKLTINDLLIK